MQRHYLKVGQQARARVPGEYRLSVEHAKTKERLPGSPFAVVMRAAAADAGRSTAAFIDGAKPLAGGAPSAATAAFAAAGAPVTLAVTLRDRFGNLALGADTLARRPAPLCTSHALCCPAAILLDKQKRGAGARQHLRLGRGWLGAEQRGACVTEALGAQCWHVMRAHTRQT
jgi:hypothetical protein